MRPTPNLPGLFGEGVVGRTYSGLEVSKNGKRLILQNSADNLVEVGKFIFDMRERVACWGVGTD